MFYGSISSDHPIIKYLEDSFSTCCEVVRLQDETGNNHLLIGVNTKLRNLSNAFMFSGHIDTVPESENHIAKARLQDFHIEGLGSVDMKGFVASLIFNLDNLKNCKIPIIISLTSDEETDFYGIETIISEMKKRNIFPNTAIIGEPTSSQIALSHRGNSIFISTVKGKSCHFSTPESGINAINLSMEAISEIEKCIQKYKGRAAICITKIEGGKACNIVPDLCRTTISVRASSKQCLEDITQDLKNIYKRIDKKAISANLINVFNIPSFEISNNSLSEILNKKNLTKFNGTTEAGFIQQAFNSPNMAIYGPGNQDCIHKAGEKISLNELTNYAASLPYLVSIYCRSENGDYNKNELQP